MTLRDPGHLYPGYDDPTGRAARGPDPRDLLVRDLADLRSELQDGGGGGGEGPPGPPGPEGPSAYEVAVANGFEGDEPAWLASLQGPPGEDGADGEDGTGGGGVPPEWIIDPFEIAFTEPPSFFAGRDSAHGFGMLFEEDDSGAAPPGYHAPGRNMTVEFTSTAYEAGGMGAYVVWQVARCRYFDTGTSENMTEFWQREGQYAPAQEADAWLGWSPVYAPPGPSGS